VSGLFRPLLVAAGLLLLWQAVVSLSGIAPYLLPGPGRVARVFAERHDLIFQHALLTTAEIVTGLILGTLLGCLSALSLAYVRALRPWLLPVLVISQAVPVFAIAPLLMLWFGYGMGSKIAMATLIIFFPVTAAFYDGLRRTEPGWLALARVMNASRWQVLRHVRIPAALPNLGSGLRVAAAVAPIGAVVGEWVGSSAGLGFLMLHANARMQVDLMFAALFTLAVIAIALYFAIDKGIRHALPWLPETSLNEKDT